MLYKSSSPALAVAVTYCDGFSFFVSRRCRRSPKRPCWLERANLRQRAGSFTPKIGRSPHIPPQSSRHVRLSLLPPSTGVTILPEVFPSVFETS